MENFCRDLREHGMRIVNYEKREMMPLIDEENESCEKQNVCYIYKKISANDYDNYNKYQEVRYHCHYTRKFRGAAHSICNLRNKTPKKILVVFHNGFTYDYHFITNQLAKEFDVQLKCLGKNKEKFVTFSVQIKKTW